MKLSHLAPALLFPLTILLALLVFWPALSGPFLFDDLVHLPKLAGADGTTDTLAEVIRLIIPEHQGTGQVPVLPLAAYQQQRLANRPPIFQIH